MHLRARGERTDLISKTPQLSRSYLVLGASASQFAKETRAVQARHKLEASDVGSPRVTTLDVENFADARVTADNELFIDYPPTK